MKKNNDFEEALKGLQKMSENIKANDTTLEESIKCYDDGMKYYNICDEILNHATQKIKIFNKNELEE